MFGVRQDAVFAIGADGIKPLLIGKDQQDIFSFGIHFFSSLVEFRSYPHYKRIKR